MLDSSGDSFVSSFGLTIALWVPWSGCVPLDSVFVEEGSVLLSGELFAIVGDNSEWDAEPGDDVPPNKADDVGFFNGDHKLGFDPFGKAVGGC